MAQVERKHIEELYSKQAEMNTSRDNLSSLSFTSNTQSGIH